MDASMDYCCGVTGICSYGCDIGLFPAKRKVALSPQQQSHIIMCPLVIRHSVSLGNFMAATDDSKDGRRWETISC